MPKPAAPALALALVATSSGIAAGEASRVDVRAAGGIAWVFSPELDLIGDLRAEVEVPAAAENAWYASLDTRTAIRRARSDFTFDVRHLEYVAEVGARHRLDGGALLGAFVGQWGLERADADGQPYARYLGVSIETPEARSAREGATIEGRVGVGVVVDRHEIDPTVLLRGDARWSAPLGRGLAWGADLTLEALAGGRGEGTEIAAGPRLDVPLAGARLSRFYLHYARSRHALGLGISGVLLGFEYLEAPGEPSGAAPDIRGRLAGGGGGGRDGGRLALQFLSPPLGRDLRIVADVEANVLTASDTGDLFYLYHVGAEGPWRRALAGAYFYHRSNHRLAEPGDRVTSINVLEAGIETPGWSRPLDPSLRGALDGRIRIGVLVDSAFGPGGRLHARGGVRWMIPGVRGPARPFAAVEAEDGQVARRIYAIGVAFEPGFDVRVEALRDEQLFARDRTAVRALVTLGF